MIIENLAFHRDLIPDAAQWFHKKWQVPLQAYLDSMTQSIDAKNNVPAWYVIRNEKGQIIAGLGVIENDFHLRPDLTPNICAVYVEPAYRKQGLSRMLLDHACRELARHFIQDVYLITTHTAYYERCGWEFLTMVEEDSGGLVRMYHKHTPAKYFKPTKKLSDC